LPARLAGARLVWHHRAGPDAVGFRFVAPWVAHGIIAVSRFAGSRPGARSPRAMCTVIHSPFDTDIAEIDRAACRADACAKLGVAPATHLLGFFGTLVQRKRPLAFVEAIAALCREAPGLPVLGLLFGNARDRLDEAAARRARELGVEDAIRLMGFRYPPEPWLAACDALLVPSVNEPFGRTLIEAMLLGTPVVAADSGGNSEAVEDGRTGLLVPADNPSALAHATRKILERPALRAALVKSAGEDVRRRFGIARHAEAVMNVYDRVLAGDA
jgi:glycosyltransferase involved in cell wall biosynthesis